jgi:formylglycine-generating enzyme required for sulfatase activity
MCRFWLSILLIGGFLGCGESDQNSSDTERNSKTPKEAKIPLQSDKTKIEKTSPFKPQGIHNVKFAGIEMIWVPAGSFQMGSPFSSPVRIMDEKPHNVELTRGFYLGKYEITQRQYALVMEENVRNLNSASQPFSRAQSSR